MNKYVAQLQQDTGATPENIVEAAGVGDLSFLQLTKIWKLAKLGKRYTTLLLVGSV